jgi:hypothetical protein
MTGSASLDVTDIKIPSSMTVSVIMESRPSASRWIDEEWSVVGVTVGQFGDDEPKQSAKVLIEQNGMRQLIYSGFSITLYKDECESYYHNLKSPEPGCYVIARNDGNEVPIPYIVSLSFDEANAYLECEDTVFTTSVPPELYRWIEQFVLLNYVPEKRVRRKRKNWKNATREQAAL